MPGVRGCIWRAVRSDVAAFEAEVPAALWFDLSAEGLVDERAVRFA